jgi:hypothetical protein
MAEDHEMKMKACLDRSAYGADDITTDLEIRKSLQAREKADRATGLYSIATADLDEYKCEYKKKVEPILEEIQHVEESRINFIKYTLEKFYRHQAKLCWDKSAGAMVD